MKYLRVLCVVHVTVVYVLDQSSTATVLYINTYINIYIYYAIIIISYLGLPLVPDGCKLFVCVGVREVYQDAFLRAEPCQEKNIRCRALTVRNTDHSLG